MGDYERVIGFHLSEGNYTSIIATLSDAPFDKVESIIYKVSPVLLEFESESTIDLWLQKSELKLSQLLPSIMRYCEVLDKCRDRRARKEVVDPKYSYIDRNYNDEEIHYGIRFLQERLKTVGMDENPSEMVAGYHCLAWLLARYDSEEEEQLVLFWKYLLDGLTHGVFPWSLDYEYLLREVKRNGRVRSVVYIYQLMGLHDEAVRFALSFDVDLAKMVASNVPDEGFRRQLWLSIARHIIDVEKDTHQAVSLLNSCRNCLKIEVSWSLYYLFYLLF